MVPLVMRVRSELRTRWLNWLVLATLIGVFAGGVMAVVAGARRTDTAFARFLHDTRAPDVMVVDEVPGTDFATFRPQDLAHLPQVTDSARMQDFTVLNPSDLTVLAPTAKDVGYRFWTRKLLAGRLPDPARADEVDVSFTTAAARHLHVGDALTMGMQPANGSSAAPVTVHVVGIDAAASEFPPQEGTGIDAVWVTPAFVHAYQRSLVSVPVSALRLAHGNADGRAVNAEITRLGHDRPNVSWLFSVSEANTQHSIHLQAIALWVLAGLLGLVGLIIASQLLARQTAVESTDYRELRALGMTTPQLWGVGLARVALVGVVASVIGVVVAIAASPLFPLGLAQTAEPHPGVSVDLWAIALGAVVTLLVLLACGAWPTWRAAAGSSLAASAQPASARPSRGLAAAKAIGGSAPSVVGITFALDARQRRGNVPVLTTFTAVVIGIAALTSAAVFTASLSNLLVTPRLYGTTWDALVQSSESEGASPLSALPALKADPTVDAISVGNSGIPLSIGGVRVDGLALDSDKGPALDPTVLSGRLPRTADEIVLGTRDLGRLHLHVGSTIPAVTLAGVHDHHPLHVVGTAIFPTLSDDLGLGHGAFVTTSYLRRAISHGLPSADTIVVRFHPGTDRAAAVDRLQREVGAGGTVSVSAPQQPTDLVNFGRVERLPLAVGGLLGLLATGTLAHLLLGSIRRRRTDLAVLKTLGFVPGQVRRTVAWQANTIITIALAVGIPLGVVAGRWIWYAFAGQLGVVAVPVVSLGVTLVLVAGAFAVANLIALLPARAAGRAPAAQTLRTA